jgi:hypothetical protein
MGMFRYSLLIATGLLASAAAANAGDMVKVFEGKDAKLQLGKVEFAGGKTLDLSVGVGSGLFHVPGDPADEFYGLTDRGPNIDCSASEEITGVPTAQACGGDDKAKLFPRPDFVPSIGKLKLNEDGTYATTDWIELKDAAGKTITGLSNPLKAAKTEAAYDTNGKQLPFDPNGLDTEGLVRLADGTFWIGEEYGPSLVHVAADGKIIERLVPPGVDKDLSGATYKVTGSLPAILAKRQLNRGIEGIALAPDESALYAIVQNPLANPDADAYKKAVATRILKLDLKSQQVVGEYVYTLDAPTTFKQDKSDKQSDVRISELSAVGVDQLIVLERIAKTTKLQAIDLSPVRPTFSALTGTRSGLRQASSKRRRPISRAKELPPSPRNSGSTAATMPSCPRRSKASRSRTRMSSSSSTTTISESMARRPGSSASRCRARLSNTNSTVTPANEPGPMR